MRRETSCPAAFIRLAGDPIGRGYCAISPLIGTVRRIADREAPWLVARFRAALDRIEAAEPSGRRGSVRLGENDPRLVLRRLTREGVGLAHDIDGGARFLLEAARACPALRECRRIEVPGLAALDRPSLRLLARLAEHDGAEDGLWTLAFAGDAQASIAARPPALGPSFDRLAGIVRQRWSLPEETVRASPPASPRPRGGVEIDFGEAFSQQHYERALAALPAAGHASLLMRALILVNLAAAAEALREIDGAIEGAAPHELASLHYLAGLIRTKACPDWDRARAHFEAGLQRSTARHPAAAMERAWLLNGAALLETLGALKGAREQREPRLTAVLRGQEQILELSLSSESEEMLYLRHNVLANTALLLEAMGLFDKAHDFWTRSFGHVFSEPAINESQLGARLPYLYRKGVLALKSGEANGAAAALAEALEAAETPRTWLMSSRVRLALACAALAAGRKRLGMRQLEDAALAAEAHRDQAHLARIGEVLDGIAKGAGGAPPMPPSKLPTYLSHIDLDPEPGSGINDRLARAATPAARA